MTARKDRDLSDDGVLGDIYEAAEKVVSAISAYFEYKNLPSGVVTGRMSETYGDMLDALANLETVIVEPYSSTPHLHAMLEFKAKKDAAENATPSKQPRQDDTWRANLKKKFELHYDFSGDDV